VLKEQGEPNSAMATHIYLKSDASNVVNLGTTARLKV